MFDDILSRAESLSSSNYHAKINGSFPNKRNGNDCLENSITQKSFLFGEKGVVFGPTVPALKETKVPPKTSDDLEIDVDQERVRLETERCFLNHVLLSRPQPSITPSAKVPSKSTPSSRHRMPIPAVSSRRDLIFAEKLRKFLQSKKKIGADDPFAEDGTVGGLPVWEVTYHCLRAGDLAAAKDALELLANFPQAAVLVASLNHLSKEAKLDVELKKKLKVEWRHNLNSAKDKYKRGLYAALLGMDSNLADSLENWLWFKLFALKIDPHLTPVIYAEVQKNVSIDYGETYFMAAGTSEFHYYFTALWLSGQFERAIKGLKTPSGGDVFEMAVSRAVYLTGQAEAIIGSLGPDGKRTPALIDE
ncbi:nucleoporin interacting component [Teladorsagia circumcincta]|uniref:Nuclear pore protein n=1 Tax=Teladorsagia circumcincta TaxID=45464 RepID=A0A2G9TZC4_TELCI|nr:nucleoporin interacting component [Teladorsagia circumcincta]